MDSMHDVPADGTKIRLLTIVDIFNRESVALEVDFGFKGPQVVNAFCESINNRVRQELLSPTWFRTLEDSRRHGAAWRHDYNTSHPHSSLDDLTPEEFARRSKK